MFYLWHLWRRDLQHHCSCNGDAEAAYVSSDSDLQAVGLQSHVNGQLRADEAMEVEGTSLPVPHDSKRLKRGVPLPDPPSLTSEYSFVSGVLDSCCNHEQKRFAAAYKKWIDTIINQQRWEQLCPTATLFLGKVAFRCRFRIRSPTCSADFNFRCSNHCRHQLRVGVEGGLCSGLPSGFPQYSSEPETWNQVAQAHYHTRSETQHRQNGQTD